MRPEHSLSSVKLRSRDRSDSGVELSGSSSEGFIFPFCFFHFIRPSLKAYFLNKNDIVLTKKFTVIVRFTGLIDKSALQVVSFSDFLMKSVRFVHLTSYIVFSFCFVCLRVCLFAILKVPLFG